MLYFIYYLINIESILFLCLILQTQYNHKILIHHLALAQFSYQLTQNKNQNYFVSNFSHTKNESFSEQTIALITASLSNSGNVCNFSRSWFSPGTP